MYYEYMKSEQQQLEKEIYKISKQLEQFPDGTLVCRRNGTRYKWYQRSNSKKTYIPKKQRQFAEQYLSAYPKTNEAELLLDNEPEFQMLLQPYLTPLLQELADWEKAPYEKNLKYPEQLTHKTVDNIFVHSKSEAMIAMALRFHKIPFRYECLLEIGNYHIYPDFTLRHPANGKLYY